MLSVVVHGQTSVDLSFGNKLLGCLQSQCQQWQRKHSRKILKFNLPFLKLSMVKISNKIGKNCIKMSRVENESDEAVRVQVTREHLMSE